MRIAQSESEWANIAWVSFQHDIESESAKYKLLACDSHYYVWEEESLDPFKRVHLFTGLENAKRRASCYFEKLSSFESKDAWQRMSMIFTIHPHVLLCKKFLNSQFHCFTLRMRKVHWTFVRQFSVEEISPLKG